MAVQDLGSDYELCLLSVKNPIPFPVSMWIGLLVVFFISTVYTPVDGLSAELFFFVERRVLLALIEL